MLREAGLLELVLPELVAAIGVEQGGYHTHDVYGHTVATVDHAPPDLVTRTAALLHDIAKPPTHVVAPDGRHTFYDHPQIGAEMAAVDTHPLAIQQRRDQRCEPAGTPAPPPDPVRP